MPATFKEARDDIRTIFVTQWDADTPAVNPNGLAPLIFFDGLPDEEEQPSGAAWAHIVIQHNTGAIDGIGGKAPTRRRTTKTGIATVQIFTPLSSDNEPFGDELAEDLAIIAKDAFEGHETPNGVLFRDVVPQEVGEDGPWYQVNVVANFEYEEFV